jgi:type I restriction enzyme S subunit
LIEKIQKKVELLKEQRTSLINQCVTKGLDPNVEMKDSGVEWIGEIPKHWSVTKLGYISDRVGDGIHSTPVYVDQSDYRFINGNNLIDGKIEFFESTRYVDEEEYNKYLIPLSQNTLLLSINGTIGNLSFYQGEKVILGKSSCYINLKSEINVEYLFWILKSHFVKTFFEKEVKGTTIFNLSLNSVRKTKFPLPSPDEQTKICEYLKGENSKLGSLIEKEEKRIRLLREYRQSLISSLVTGKVRVTEDMI